MPRLFGLIHRVHRRSITLVARSMEQINLHTAARDGTLFQVPASQLTVENLTAPAA